MMTRLRSSMTWDWDSMDEYANNFLELLRYVWYIRDEKVKVQCILSGLPQFYKDRIEFYKPRTLEEAIRKDNYCYEQRKSKLDYHKAWKTRRMRSLTKERKVSNLLTSGISRSSHPKLRVNQLEWHEKSLRIHNRIEDHFNVGDVDDPRRAELVHWRMRV